MSVNDISLTAGMRSNLINLQGTVSLLNRTQQRLSSGKKVNTALDNPTAFFAAQNLTQAANDLSTLKDAMSQAVQTVTAANQGISSIQTLLQSAQGLAQSALSTSDLTTRANYAVQFNQVLEQINKIAGDSGYQGTNLLANNNLTVNFSADGASSLTITGAGANAGISLTALTANPGGGTSTWDDAAAITDSVNELTAATTSLRSTAASLSSGLTIINTRQDFTTQMINTLTTGADNLQLADMNEEGANMLMLQTRQSLGTTALSLSSQAAQAVLRLFQ